MFCGEKHSRVKSISPARLAPAPVDRLFWETLASSRPVGENQRNITCSGRGALPSVLKVLTEICSSADLRVDGDGLISGPFKAEAKAGPRFLKRDFGQNVIAIGPSLLLPQTGERTGRELLEFAWMIIRRPSVAPTALLQ